MRACSEPPPSRTGCTERTIFLRVGINVEQLLYRSPGGIGRYTAQLLTLLPALGAGVEVVPFSAWHARPKIEEVLRSNATGEHRPPVRLALPRPLLYEAWVRFGQPPLALSSRALGRLDLVHAPSLAIPPKGRAPVVATVFDAASELYPEAFTPRGRRFHRRALFAAARRAELVITATEAAADEIVTHSNIEHRRIRVVPLCVDPPPPDPEADAAALARFGLAGTRYVLWVGSLEPRKAVGVLVAAMARLGRRGTKLVLAGYDGWLSEQVIRTADRVIMGSDLLRLGKVSDSELWALYRGATIFAFPSRHEGFGLPVLEAMSQGVSVICSDIPALREVTAGSAQLVGAGRIELWAEALSALLDDDVARKTLGQAGQARSAEFSSERMARGTISVYREAIGG